MNTTYKKQEAAAESDAHRAFRLKFGTDDFSFGMLDEKPTRDGGWSFSWEAECGKKYSRCFQHVTATGEVPFPAFAT